MSVVCCRPTEAWSAGTRPNINPAATAIEPLVPASRPAIARSTLERDGYHSIPYGNFVDRMEPTKGWKTFDHRPRYLNNYVGLRNRFSILIEMYAYAGYEERVLSCRAFLQSIAEFAAAHGEAMRNAL